MKKLPALLAIILILGSPHITNAGWISDLFKKEKTEIKQINNQKNSNSNSTNIGDTKIDGDVVNIPDQQKSYILNFKDLQELFAPLFSREIENSEKNTQTLKTVIEPVKSLADIAIELKTKKPLDLSTETQTFISSLKQDVVTPLGVVGTNLQLIAEQLSTNNTALINALTTMSFIPNQGGGSGEAVTKSIVQAAHGFTVGQWVYLLGNVYTLTDADVPASTVSVGVVSAVTNANTFKLTTDGYVSGLSGLVIGTEYYMAPTPGAISSVPNGKLVLITDSATSGWVQQASIIGVSPVTAQTASFTAQWGKTYTIVPSAALTITLPTAVGNNGKDITVIRTDATSNIVTIDPNGSETINGQATLALANSYSANTIRSNGTNVIYVQGASNVEAEYGENNTIVHGQTTSSPTLSAVINGTISVPSAGGWNIGFNAYAWQTLSGQTISFVIKDSLGNIVANSAGSGAGASGNVNGAQLISQNVNVVTTGATVYSVYWGTSGAGTATIVNNNPTTIAGSSVSKTFYQKVSGFLPLSGQINDLVNAKPSTNQTIASTVATTVTFDTINIGNIPVSTVGSVTTFSLTANKVYTLVASLQMAGPGQYAQYQWVDGVTNVAIANGSLGFAIGVDVTSPSPSSNNLAFISYAPSVNQTVSVRTTTSSGGTPIVAASGSYVMITQVGSSNISTLTAFTGATSTVAGTGGLVPAPSIGGNSKVLLGSGVFGSSLVGIRVLTSGTSYTPTPGTNKIIAYVIGGGGGGGAVASSASTFSGGGGGAGGVVGFSETVSDQTTYTYSIGAAGASSGTGGASSITVNSNVYTSQGGLGGADGTTNAPSVTTGVTGGATSPVSATGNAFYASIGGAGETGFSVATNNHASGKGGSNMFGTGGRPQAFNAAGSAAGISGISFGAGGSGALQNNSTARSGGLGSAGAILIQEIR